MTPIMPVLVVVALIFSACGMDSDVGRGTAGSSITPDASQPRSALLAPKSTIPRTTKSTIPKLAVAGAARAGGFLQVIPNDSEHFEEKVVAAVEEAATNEGEAAKAAAFVKEPPAAKDAGTSALLHGLGDSTVLEFQSHEGSSAEPHVPTASIVLQSKAGSPATEDVASQHPASDKELSEAFQLPGSVLEAATSLQNNANCVQQDKETVYEERGGRKTQHVIGAHLYYECSKRCFEGEPTRTWFVVVKVDSLKPITMQIKLPDSEPTNLPSPSAKLPPWPLNESPAIYTTENPAILKKVVCEAVDEFAYWSYLTVD